ncbi:MAG: PD-(D/E)XK nuclease family protein [Armatimonadetes bacterium]|nr:PD-(D/E)XK nuclease family protein [Armatimonadota bacterium]
MLTWPGSLDGTAAEPSPFLDELADHDEPAPERLAAVTEWRGEVLRPPGIADEVTSHALAAWQVEQRRESAEPPDQYDGALGEPMDLPATFSASQLTALGPCPFKWLAGKAFGLEPVEEPDAEPDPLTRGGLFHRVLELAVRAARLDGCLTADGLTARLSPAMDAALGQPPASHAEPLARAVAESAAEAGERTAVEDDDRGRFLGRLPNWERIREEWLAGLERAVRAESFLTDGAGPAELESWFRGEWLDLPVVGRVDRVDRGPAGVVLLDYKAGGSRPDGITRRETGKLGIDLQLPLYCAVYGQGATGAYLLLGKGRRDTGPRDDQSAELEAFAGEVLWRFDEGAFPVMPDVDVAACRYCEFSAICRVGQRNERKERT